MVQKAGGGSGPVCACCLVPACWYPGDPEPKVPPSILLASYRQSNTHQAAEISLRKKATTASFTFDLPLPTGPGVLTLHFRVCKHPPYPLTAAPILALRMVSDKCVWLAKGRAPVRPFNHFRWASPVLWVVRMHAVHHPHPISARSSRPPYRSPPASTHPESHARLGTISPAGLSR